MTWKRCDGCTRAIPANAFTCEYCGQLCAPAMAPPPAAPAHTRAGRAGDQLIVAEGGALPLPDPAEPWAGSPWNAVGSGAPEERGAPMDWSLALGTPGQDEHDDARPAFPRADPDFSSFEEEPAPPAGGAEALRTPVSVAGPASARRISARHLAMAGGAVIAASALFLTTLSMRGSAARDAAAPLAATPGPLMPGPRPAAVAARLAPLAADAPSWSRVTDGRWVGASRHAAAFEVRALNRVQVWMRDVTPLLVVRCEAGAAEAFVFTQSAARMEPQDGDHTVRFTFDDSEEITERWPDSAEHDALFARNQGAFTQRLAQARWLRFGFTPHNADRVTATFAVGGLADLMKSAARQCGVAR